MPLLLRWWVASNRPTDPFPLLTRIKQTELAERRAFVTRTKQALVKVWNSLESDYVKQKMANDERDVSERVLLLCCGPGRAGR